MQPRSCFRGGQGQRSSISCHDRGIGGAHHLSEISVLGPTGSVKFGRARKARSSSIRRTNRSTRDCSTGVSGTRATRSPWSSAGRSELSRRRSWPQAEKGTRSSRRSWRCRTSCMRLCRQGEDRAAGARNPRGLYPSSRRSSARTCAAAIRHARQAQAQEAEEAIVERVAAEYCPEGVENPVHEESVVAAVMEDLPQGHGARPDHERRAGRRPRIPATFVPSPARWGCCRGRTDRACSRAARRRRSSPSRSARSWTSR